MTIRSEDRWLSPFTKRVPGVRLWLTNLVAGAFTCWAFFSGPEGKSTCCPCRRPGLSSLHPHGGSPSTRSDAAFWLQWALQAHGAKDRYAGETPIHINETKYALKKLVLRKNSCVYRIFWTLVFQVWGLFVRMCVCVCVCSYDKHCPKVQNLDKKHSRVVSFKVEEGLRVRALQGAGISA